MGVSQKVANVIFLYREKKWQTLTPTVFVFHRDFGSPLKGTKA